MSADSLAKALAGRIWQAVSGDKGAQDAVRKSDLEGWVSTEHPKSEDPVVLASDAFLYVVVESGSEDVLVPVLSGILAFLKSSGWKSPSAAALKQLQEILADETPDKIDRVESWFYSNFPQDRR